MNLSETMFDNIERVCGKYPTSEELRYAIGVYLSGNDTTIETIARMYEEKRGIKMLVKGENE